MQLLFPNIKKLASVLICGSSPAHQLTSSPAHQLTSLRKCRVLGAYIFLCILHVGFYCLSFRFANVCHVQYFSGKSKISNCSQSSNNRIMHTLLSRRAEITKQDQERYSYSLQFNMYCYRDHGSLAISCFT